MKRNEYHQQFNKHFPAYNSMDFIDPLITEVYRRANIDKISIDLIKFDDVLKKDFSETYSDEMSMKEFLEFQFGKDACLFVCDMLEQDGLCV